MEDLRIFIYNNNTGEKIEERNYDFFEETFDEIVKHNVDDPNNFRNLYIGKEFPPNGYTWNPSNKNWIDYNNNDLKIFIYNDEGEKIKEDFYYNILDIYSEVYNHNNINPNDLQFIYYGSQFPPVNHHWDNNLKDWILNETNNSSQEIPVEEIPVEEIPIEEISGDQTSNFMKVYVYDTKGQLIKEDFYSNFLDVYDYVLNHNTNNINDPYNIYPGTEFPPKGYKWSNDKGDWVELSLYEKYKKGQLDIPDDCAIINNIIVRKSLSQLHKEGLYKIQSNQKIDEEYNIVIDKTQQELIDEGLLDWEEVYKYYYNEFKRKMDANLDLYYFKYPKSIIFQFNDKARMAKLWRSFTPQDKEVSRMYSYGDFSLLISEFKDINKDYTLDEIEAELDKLSDKIIAKNIEIENKLGSINNFFNSLYEEISSIKETKNFSMLFDFVGSIENKISQWIKS